MINKLRNAQGLTHQAKLLRLARAGEAWAEKEAAGYAEAIPGRRPLTAVMAEQIRDLASDIRSVGGASSRR